MTGRALAADAIANPLGTMGHSAYWLVQRCGGGLAGFVLATIILGVALEVLLWIVWRLFASKP